MTTKILLTAVVVLFASNLPSRSQIAQTSSASSMNGKAEADQTAAILGIAISLQELHETQARRSCASLPTSEEIALRQTLLETEVMASFDVDGVLSEIAAERADLQDLRTSLQARRDKTVGYLNAAALITGAGVGIVVNATQLNDSSAIPGDYVGVGSGVASTVLSVLAIKKMHGPKQSVGTIPNMLAPLFDQKALLKTYYPPAVMQYLQSVPPSEDASRGTRLEQLKTAWVDAKRIDTSGSAVNRQKIIALTSSTDPSVKLSIDDLNDRMAMLNDVSSRVAFMKRDVGSLMRSYQAKSVGCTQ